ncbi:component of cytosolic 80S ribosome and 60S large subunit [Volvox carteri f. nagariensis]|uniref:Component of cytosolic 80S ribosome and 60S large subunit n=1 Tax=Volvox carteri f. nagariensis TaxID=3068 RepID=D8TPX9_VOLCA|nr:component of cytosolic 80S ribosome and 60S large subunit [Volvox carteri f. nagariensis]EFJ50307.1 component of cytosolic 80S ribosome and 60S large subunit [Volvox carteri f. nagariensis]|eukprot:XP_002948432.1 component of cytosolic 80S ribosome and 60S large subunit [Volvox carteri f. nagariensis]
MVLKTNTCRFSGLRIYPGKGLLFIRTDGQQYMFLNKKCKSYYHNRLRPAKLAWTVTYRKQHKKDQVSEVQKKKRRAVAKSANRSIVGASLEVIQKKRTEKPEVRQASREAAIREVKVVEEKLKTLHSAVIFSLCIPIPWSNQERMKKQKAERAAAAKAAAGPQKAAPKVVGRGKR